MENKRNEKDMYYRCYSITLRNFLRENNVYHILTAYDVKSKCQLWLYYKSEEFEKIMKIWHENNPRKEMNV